MKILCTILFSILFFNSHAQNDSEINQLNASGEKHGKWAKKYTNGKLKYEGQFENGIPIGEFKRYNEKGKLTSTLLYSDKE
jgi:antitoxin component YwqK of YwqJK toxin-antitoxin module